MAASANDQGLNFALYKTVAYSGGTGFSTTVKTGMGKLAGIMVTAAASSPLLTVIDGTSSTGTVIIDAFTPVAGTLYRFDSPVLFTNGLHLYSGGSVKATVAYF